MRGATDWYPISSSQEMMITRWSVGMEVDQACDSLAWESQAWGRAQPSLRESQACENQAFENQVSESQAWKSQAQLIPIDKTWPSFDFDGQQNVKMVGSFTE